MRSDARRNRELLLDAARQVVAERGLAASLDEIARRAGVANATLYRRFPTRVQLYEALFADLDELMRQAAEEAEHTADAWVAFTTYLERICVVSAANRGLGDLMAAEHESSPSLRAMARHHALAVAGLLARVQRQGAVRADVTAEDMQAVLYGLHRTIEVVEPIAPGAWRRYLAVVVGGLRARPDDSPLPLPAIPPGLGVRAPS